jgi:HEAT repeat protein
MTKCTLLTAIAFAVASCLGCSNERKPLGDDVPSLIENLRKGDDATKADAAQALGELGAAAEAAVPALMLALRDEYELVRQQAAEALGEIGPAAKSAVSALRIASRDGVPQVREAALRAINKIDPKAKR